MNRIKRCAQGHYYNAALDHCPYCPTSSGDSISTMGAPGDGNHTEDVSGLGFGCQSGGPATEQFKETKENRPNEAGAAGTNDETRTSYIGNGLGRNDGEETISEGGGQGSQRMSPTPSGGTIIIDDGGFDAQGQQQISIRDRRKLVGWLVSYTLDKMGMDFKLYEGRNIIGRTANCQITIADKTVSGTHAVILFRAGEYSITDQQSTSGTFVNNEDIKLAPRYLKDGDVIRIGQTLFRFRSSL